MNNINTVSINNHHQKKKMYYFFIIYYLSLISTVCNAVYP